MQESALAVAAGGHGGALDCVACHGDRRPGRVGRRHRGVLDCVRCHDEVRHPVRTAAAAHVTRACLSCHDPHGAANAKLIPSPLRVGRRLRPIAFADAGGAVPGGFVSPDGSGRGLCEVCHRRTDFWRADGRDMPHFTQDCTLCHAHAVGFGLDVTDQSCPICHQPEAQRFAAANQHSMRFQCASCHAAVDPAPGPGHRAATRCEACHDTGTHAPPGTGALPCTQCHDPHGTANAWLVLETITTTQGVARPITFDNLLGLAAGSFASPSAPGSGICEICHTTTRFYRADGTGEQHFPFSCSACHTHAAGFAPPP